LITTHIIGGVPRLAHPLFVLSVVFGYDGEIDKVVVAVVVH